MLKPFQALLSVLAHATQRELARQIQFLKTENRILRDKLPQRITITPKERGRLLKFGTPVGAAINQLITIVVPSTFARWVREEGSKKPRRRTRGRPKKLPDLR